MSIESIRFRTQVKQVRLAFAKIDCQPTEKLISKYRLSTTFLQQLLKVGLLSLGDTVYCKGKRWTDESSMTLNRFISIAESNMDELAPNSAPKPLYETPPTLHDNPVITPFLGQILKSRRSLTMGLKFTKGKEFSCVLSWYSTHSSSVIGPMNSAARTRYYEQEVFEIGEKIYRIVDLEDHLLKALEEFFENSIKLTIQRIHHE
ncbi:MAG: hypothetical protein EOP45_09035 [Sphingobacteriaceae bacterium]|nr:MAG: hypothetical protein EOP45_09035 [Sphingobacteriaceae bacterium]